MSTTDSEEEKYSVSSNTQLRLKGDILTSSKRSPFEWNRKNMRCKKQGCWCPIPIIHPLGIFKIIWDLFISIIVIISCIEIPFSAAFEIDISLQTGIGRIIFGVNMLLLIDIILTFRCAYYDQYDKLRLIINPFLITKHYLKTWFLLDLITSFPLYILFKHHGFDDTVFQALRIMRLLRIFKVSNIIRTKTLIKKITRVIPKQVAILIQVVQILAAMLFCCHYFACLWYAVGKASYHDEHKQSWMDEYKLDLIPGVTPIIELYSASFYWSVVTLFTTGYGDITAQNSTEMWIACLVIIVGSIFTAYLIATITGVLSEGNTKLILQNEMIDQVYEFCQYYRISNNLLRKLEESVKYHIRYNYNDTGNKFLKILPQHLKQRIGDELAARTNKEFNLNDIDLFKELPSHVAGQLFFKLKSVSCNAHCKLYNSGDIAEQIYIQKIGECKLVYDDKNMKIKRFKRGDIFGEKCLISNRRHGTLICKTFCEFYVLNKYDIKNTIFDGRYMNKQDAERVWSNTLKRLQVKYDKHNLYRKIKFNKGYNQTKTCCSVLLNKIRKRKRER
eukprot:233579_1